MNNLCKIVHGTGGFIALPLTVQIISFEKWSSEG